MKVRFWGTRGSIARPGRDTLRYGGNTSCIEVRSPEGHLLVIDCGTGLFDLGRTLAAEGSRPLRGHILISHTHWDHIQGIPFFAPLFVPGNEWDFYAPRGISRSLRQTLAGQMQYTYFPVELDALGAEIRYHELVEGVFTIGDVTVRTQYLNHPALTLGYRLEAAGTTVVYACDHEPFLRHLASGQGDLGEQDRRHMAFLQGADLVIHDAQYTDAEYEDKVGWGHSTLQYAAEMCRRADVRQLAFTHHDPLRSDEELDRLQEDLQGAVTGTGSDLRVVAAREGAEIALAADSEPRPESVPDELPAKRTVVPAIWEHRILLVTEDGELAELLSEAAEAENIKVKATGSLASAVQMCTDDPPSLVILDHRLADDGVAEACRMLRGREDDAAADLPVVVVTDTGDTDAPPGAAVTDWLIRPFSVQYARTRIRAWILRNTCRWIRAPLPQNEERRLTALKGLDILDTAPEERFDWITRLASSLFDVSMALVSLVDLDRQWFKSCIGFDVRESPREEAFCSHAILSDETLIVPDTLLDERFAENPLVTGGPRLRFYAGCPLSLGDGVRVGTLCILDTRPRHLDAVQLEQLRNLADLVEKELVAPRVMADT